MFHYKNCSHFGGGYACICSVNLEGLPFYFSDYVYKYNFIPYFFRYLLTPLQEQ